MSQESELTLPSEPKPKGARGHLRWVYGLFLQYSSPRSRWMITGLLTGLGLGAAFADRSDTAAAVGILGSLVGAAIGRFRERQNHPPAIIPS